jgi:hypothetical protein
MLVPVFLLFCVWLMPTQSSGKHLHCLSLYLTGHIVHVIHLLPKSLKFTLVGFFDYKV